MPVTAAASMRSASRHIATMRESVAVAQAQAGRDVRASSSAIIARRRFAAAVRPSMFGPSILRFLGHRFCIGGVPLFLAPIRLPSRGSSRGSCPHI